MVNIESDRVVAWRFFYLHSVLSSPSLYLSVVNCHSWNVNVMDELLLKLTLILLETNCQKNINQIGNFGAMSVIAYSVDHLIDTAGFRVIISKWLAQETFNIVAKAGRYRNGQTTFIWHDCTYWKQWIAKSINAVADFQ